MNEILNYIDSIKLLVEKSEYEIGYNQALIMIEIFISEKYNFKMDEDNIFLNIVDSKLKNNL